MEGTGPARGRGGAADLQHLAQQLTQHLVAAGYDPIDPPLLHDAGTFLDLGGEDIRARLYLTADAAGRELCLRPEFTIPAASAYLSSPATGRPASYSYCGPVFRMRAESPGELRQAGLESFGRADIAAADAEVLALSLDAVERSGTRLAAVSLGDAGLVSAVLDAVELPPLWQRRIKRGLERGLEHGHERGFGLDAALRGAPARRPEHSGLLAALAGADGQDAHALVTDLLSIAGITAVGGRSVGEIADRFVSQVAQAAAPDVGDERRELLDAFFAIGGDPDRASGQLRALADAAGLDLAAALDLFDERIGFIAAQGVELSRLAFRTAFARNLDYYTGFVFEAHGADPDGPVIGGGRYDRLCQALGSAAVIPAVGAAIWLDRMDRADPETGA